MTKKTLNLLLIILFIIGLIGAGGLVLDEIQTGNGCPKIATIPVCIVVLICFAIPLAAHILRRWNVCYFVFTGMAAAIAIVASVMQFTGKGECPKLDNNIPMCYLSLLIFTLLILLKIAHLKKPSN